MTTLTALHDVVPARVREEWTRSGHYPGKDLFRCFEEHALSAPYRPAVIDDSETVDFASLASAAKRVANALVAAGLADGEVVGIQLPNSWQACAVELGVAAAGAVSLPFPTGRGRRDVKSLLSRSEAAAVVVGNGDSSCDNAAVLRSLRDELPLLRHVFALPNHDRDFLALGPVLSGAAGSDAWSPRFLDPDTPGRVLVSSGTEAEPKMVVYSHNGMVGGRGNFIAALNPTGRPMRAFFLVPLGSSYGSNATCSTLARHGATIVLMSRFEAERALASIHEHRPTHILGVPAMFQMMLDCPKIRQVDLSCVEAVVSGGATISTSTVREIEAVFGATFVNLYGSADGTNCHTKPGDGPDRRYTTVGRPNPAVASMRIVDDQGEDLPAGAPGEIWSRGPISPMCYLNAPELDQRYRTEGGWVRTGDVGVLDEEGYLSVVGRMKNIIVRGGENISPEEVENLLHGHPSVLHAACVGMPDRRLGEKMCAFVVPRQGSRPPTLDELTAFLLEEKGLSKHKLPERLELLRELPFNPAGKVLTRVLQERVADLLQQEEGMAVAREGTPCPDTRRLDDIVPAKGLDLVSRAVSQCYDGHLGMALSTSGGGRAVSSLPFEPTLAHRGMPIQGGIIAALIDVAATAAVWSGDVVPTTGSPTTQSMNVTVLARPDEDIEATAQVVGNTEGLVLCDVDVQGVSGKPVAKAIVTYRLAG